MTQWKPMPREPAKSEAELREMFSEPAVRKAATPEPPGPKAAPAPGSSSFRIALEEVRKEGRSENNDRFTLGALLLEGGIGPFTRITRRQRFCGDLLHSVQRLSGRNTRRRPTLCWPTTLTHNLWTLGAAKPCTCTIAFSATSAFRANEESLSRY
jgi:hypothetical protein